MKKEKRNSTCKKTSDAGGGAAGVHPPGDEWVIAGD